MLTMRPFNEDKSWGDKQKKVYYFDEDGNKIYDPTKRQYKCNKAQTTDWNEQSKAEEWRAAWAETANRYLEKMNHTERIDHRSYERQGIEQIPTVHLGVAAFQMEKRGIATERGNMNREIEVSNKHLREIKARLAKLQTWLKEEMKNTEPPTLADVISNIIARREQTGQSSRYSSIHNLQAAANILNFLTVNKIMDMAGLDGYLMSMTDKRLAIVEKLKPVERRLNTLSEHIDHAEKYRATRSYKIQYDKLYAEYETLNKSTGLFTKGKAQKALDTANAYYETNAAHIIIFNAADRYLRDVLQGRFDPAKLPPITKWKAESEKLNTDRVQLDREYKQLKADTLAVEKIRSNVYDIMREESRGIRRTRTQGMEL